MAVLEVHEDVLRQAFNMVLAQWPTEIRPGLKTFHINGGTNMRNLNEVHEPVEDWVNSTDLPAKIDDIIGSVEHYVFATIHDALKNLTVLHTKDVDFEAFCSRFDSHPSFRVIRD